VHALAFPLFTTNACGRDFLIRSLVTITGAAAKRLLVNVAAEVHFFSEYIIPRSSLPLLLIPHRTPLTKKLLGNFLAANFVFELSLFMLGNPLGCLNVYFFKAGRISLKNRTLY
jgi:hypothetical protein